MNTPDAMPAAPARPARLGRPTARAQRFALLALLATAVVTIVWWALALWPVPGEAPAWLARTRAVCFNAGPNGLPDASGWLVLTGQPLCMLGILAAGWGRPLRAGLAGLTRSAAGRVALAGGLGIALIAVAAVLARVSGWPGGEALAAEPALPVSFRALDRDAPPLGLVDQHGDTLTLDTLAGRTLLVTFAFAHCETVCPMVVHQSLAARDLARDADVVVLVITLDPWRDTPARLPAIAEQWALSGDAYVLSGSVGSVQAVLDAWDVPRSRDVRTGDVTHPPLIYVVDGDGRIVYSATGGVDSLAALLRRTG